MEILSLNNQEDSAAVENELAMIVDMMEEEVEQQARSGGAPAEGEHSVPEGDAATVLDFSPPDDVEDDNVRHTDMIHSIQEAIEQGKKHRQQDSYLIEEMKRLLRVFRMANIENRHGGAAGSTAGSSSGNGNTNNFDAVMTKTESRLIGILQQCSLKSFTRYLAMIEQAELNGFPAESGLEIHREAYAHAVHGNSHGTSAKKHVLPWMKLCGKRFSIEFHRQLNEVIKQRIAGLENTTSSKFSSQLPENVIQALRLELDARVNLLKSFEYFVKSNRHYFNELRYSLTHAGTAGNDSDPSLSLSPLGSGIGVGITALSDDPTMLCRQNNHRAEALCWTLRQIRKVDEHYGTPMHIHTGSRPGTAPNSPLHQAISPLSPNRKASNIIPTFRNDSIVILNDPSRPMVSPMQNSATVPDGAAAHRVEGKHSVVHNLTPTSVVVGTSVASKNNSPIPGNRFKPGGVNDGVKNRADASLAGDINMALSGVEYINFSLFRSFHDSCKDPDGEFSYFPKLDTLRILIDQSKLAEDANAGSLIFQASNLSSVDAMFAYKQAHPNQLKTLDILNNGNNIGVDYYLQSSVTTEFLSFFFRSLVGDLECFKAFTSALKYEGSFLYGPLGLKTLMPGFYLLLSQHSLKSLVSDLLSRKVSTSPFQR